MASSDARVPEEANRSPGSPLLDLPSLPGMSQPPRWLDLFWRVIRATTLMAALAVLYLGLHRTSRAASGAVGLGFAWVILTAIPDPPAHAARAWCRTRVMVDCLLVLLVVLLARDEGRPLGYLFAVPIADASLFLGVEELLTVALILMVGGLAATLGMGGLAPDHGLSQVVGSIVLVVLVFLVLARLVREVRELRLRERMLRRLLRETAAVSRVAVVIHQRLSAKELGDVVTSSAIDLLGAHAATLALAADGLLRAVSTQTLGPDAPDTESLPLNGLAEADEVTVTAADDGFGTLLRMTLRGEDHRVVGRLSVLDPRPPNGIPAEDRRALYALGVQSAAACEQANLRASLEDREAELVRKVGELSDLFEVSRALVQLDRHEVLDEVLSKAISMMNAERGSLMLLDETSHELVIETARGLPASIIESTRVKLGEGFAGRVAASATPLRLLDTLEPGEARAGLRDALCVPLQIHDKVIGVLNISNKNGPGVFTEHDLNMLSALGNQAAISIQNTRLFEDLQELFLSTISSLAKAVDANDRYTAGHSHRVTLYALEVARELGLDDDSIDLLRVAALMHDIGKLGVGEQILRKPGPLTADERTEMQQHPLYGASIVAPIRQLQTIVPGVRHHHERYDGRGYPDGLTGSDIPLQARVLMVADAYDAMTSDRPYRAAMPDEQAIDELRRGAGTQWAPEIVEAFIAAFEKGRIQPIHGQMPGD